MDINIIVENVDLSTELGGWTHDQDGDESRPITLADRVAYQIAEDLKREQFYGEVRDRVKRIRDEEIRALVAAELDAAMTAPIQKTNSYGEVVGQTTTLRELIVAEAHAFFTVKRRPNGRYDGPTSTAAEDVVSVLVKETVAKELAAAVAEEKTRVVTAVRAKAADLIAQAVKEGIGR